MTCDAMEEKNMILVEAEKLQRRKRPRRAPF